MARDLAVIVLAAGKGTRMKSELPKVLHVVGGVPMAQHVIDAARAIDPKQILVVVGHQRQAVREALDAEDLVFVDQVEQLGTGDAVRRCQGMAGDAAEIMVLNGDCPLIEPQLLLDLVQVRGDAPMSFVTARVDDPGRLGRVLRDEDGGVTGIIEANEYEGREDGPAEINAGQYLFDAAWLWSHVGRLPRSGNGEIYLTHLPAAARIEGNPAATAAADAESVLGVDDRIRLAEAEAVLRKRTLDRHMLAGVTIVDPTTTYIDAKVRIEPDVTILPNTMLRGETTIRTGTVVGPGAVLRNAHIGRETTIAGAVIEESEVGDRVHVGYYCHIRGDARIGDDCFLGNFAEVKNSLFGPGVKMHHFSFVGDADVGARANISAGVVTCNYDGEKKNRTVIGEGAFVGCDTMLVAPVEMGAGARSGAGAVVRSFVPPGALAVGVPARLIEGKPKDQ